MHEDRYAPGAPFGAVALRSLAPLDGRGALGATVAAGQEFNGRSNIEGSLVVVEVHELRGAGGAVVVTRTPRCFAGRRCVRSRLSGPCRRTPRD